ncbi:hypothetical protein K7432_003424 [Basidiobolus ranarum]|uniref:Uncharacterized protein n=1 Tax=Basidiobolus ranarum TaxID=34480 RepID=A0ABR2W6B4_9FUNG
MEAPNQISSDSPGNAQQIEVVPTVHDSNVTSESRQVYETEHPQATVTCVVHDSNNVVHHH